MGKYVSINLSKTDKSTFISSSLSDVVGTNTSVHNDDYILMKPNTSLYGDNFHMKNSLALVRSSITNKTIEERRPIDERDEENIIESEIVLVES
jgi:hypothetical protein